MERAAAFWLTRGIFVQRLLVVYVLVIGWSVLIMGRLLDLQVLQADVYRQKAAQQVFGFRELIGRRGDVFDRQLGELAVSVPVKSLSANPNHIENPAEATRRLAPLLGVEEERLFDRLQQDRVHVYLQRRLEPKVSEAIGRLEIKGLYLERESKRFYPGNQLAGHILGFVGVDGKAWSGVELAYNENLKGVSDRVELSVDAKRRSFSSQKGSRATAGDSIILTLDSTIQFAAEQALSKTVEATRAINGSAIVMNPQNGEILAMASYPPFDPNLYNTDQTRHQRNRAIQDMYEPGSTFKVVTLAAVLDQGVATIDETIDCRVGTLRLAGKVYREAKRSYGELTVEEILAKSSNVGTIKLALRLGNEKFYEYIKRFGFGEQTGIDLPFEVTGRIRTPPEWSRISIGPLAIGQELSVTALQMLRAVSVIANGGYLVEPRVVSRIVSPNGQLVAAPATVRRRVIKAETARVLRGAMSQTIEHGTGRRAQLSGFSAGGKTGTAQKFVGRGYSRTKYISSFFGFGPVENPALATIVVINEPMGGYYGGLVAAPVFKEIMERGLIKLGVPRDGPSGLRMASDRKRAEPVAAPGVSEKRDLSMEGLHQTVAALVGSGRDGAVEGNVVTQLTKGIHLPDFKGLSLREVAIASARFGLSLSYTGSGRVVGQRPPPRTLVGPGTVCEVVLSEQGEIEVATRGPYRGASAQVSADRHGAGFED